MATALDFASTEPLILQLLFDRGELVVPVATRGEALDVAFATPNEMLILDEVQLLTGLAVRPLIAPLSVVERLIDVLYGGAQGGHDFSGAEEFEQADEEDDDYTVE